LDAKTEGAYKFFVWTIDRAILAPRLGLDVYQRWPYAPYQEMIVTLAYAGRAALLFLSLATITLLICGAPVELRQLALLGALFTLPFLTLMSSLVPAPKSISPALFANSQVNTLPVLGLLPLVFTFLTVRRLPRLPLTLTLVLMALFMGAYTFIARLPDEQKRNAVESMVQVGMIAYIFTLTLFVYVRRLAQSGAKEDDLHAT